MANFAKKMKKLITLTTALAVAFAQISCEDISPEGPQVDGIRSVSSFEKIELKFKGDVFFSQSDTREINVKTAQNLQSYILTTAKYDYSVYEKATLLFWMLGQIPISKMEMLIFMFPILRFPVL